MFNNEMTNKYSKDINSENYMNGNTLKNNLRNNLIFDSSNILLNSLKFFFDAYETKNQQKSSKIKFIISFEEIISLINETLISQQKLIILYLMIKVRTLILLYKKLIKNLLVI